jgi:2-keto-4-pentenoate hydratase/2-oxohepta-3-ene-1,7-dioic acid hydratase in catechol pathway
LRVGTVELEDRGQVLAIFVGDEVFDLAVSNEILARSSPGFATLPDNAKEFLSMGQRGIDAAKKVQKYLEEEDISSLLDAYLGKVDGVRIKAPITNPGKILCLAGNYADHVEECKMFLAHKNEMNPWVFPKTVPNCLIGPGDAIQIPKVWKNIDWEAELAIVIGKSGKYIPASEALEYVAGYTCFNDVSGRNLCLNGNRHERDRDAFYDWLHGKCMDTFAALGPWIVTRDEFFGIPDLRIALRVNGVTKQDARTTNMIFQIPEIIEFVSQLMTLEPGDIIATGTPSGVGMSREVPEFLKPGDDVEVDIEGIGVLFNPVVAE